MFTNCKKTLIAATLLTSVLTSGAFAQRERTQEDRQQTRENRQERNDQLTPEQRRQNFEQRWQERYKNATPEQRTRMDQQRQMMQQQQRQMQLAQVSGEDRQRYLMKSAGIEDAETQDLIFAFVKSQSEHRLTVTEEGRKLSLMLADAATTPEAFTEQHEKLKTAAKEFRVWKEGALKELDSKIHFSTNPRLNALLALVSIIGDEGTDAGGFNAMFPNGLAGDGDLAALLPPVEWGGRGGGGFGGGGNRGGGGDGAAGGGNAGGGGNAEAAPAQPAAQQPEAAN